MRSADLYQYALIFLLVVVASLFGVFTYFELFPEYKIFQNAYVELEEFKSSYTGQPVPAFSKGVKQIVLVREDKGPPAVDRCESCHVAMKLTHFSPTKLAYDINGNIVVDSEGHPITAPNDSYIWGKLDEKIAELSDEKVLAQLEADGKSDEARSRLKQAEELKGRKTVTIAGHTYDMTKVVAMHPLLGRETRPFEFHPIEEFGCVQCHSGNGRGLTTDKAHGPIFDEEYEIDFQGPKPEFTESSPGNDPRFSKVFNAKPGHDLLFQTSPLFVGGLMQAQCAQCHQPSAAGLQDAVKAVSNITERKGRQSEVLEKALRQEEGALVGLIAMKRAVAGQGFAKTLQALKEEHGDLRLTDEKIKHVERRLNYLTSLTSPKELRALSDEQLSQKAIASLEIELVNILGTPALVKELEGVVSGEGKEQDSLVKAFVAKHRQQPKSVGTLFIKADALDQYGAVKQKIKNVEGTLDAIFKDEKIVALLSSDLDEMTENYHRGKELFISEGCYACHRIAGFARGGVGPELTRIGYSYPWYIKESIVWPQADLHSSTMPNFNLDHQELEDLMAFLLAQRGESKAISAVQYNVAVKNWEAGAKLPFEKALQPSEIHEIKHGMTTYATEGCAACHRLKGFISNVGYTAEKGKPGFKELYAEKEWFKELFPEEIVGTRIVETIEKHAQEIDWHIADRIRQESFLEEIEAKNPLAVAQFYSNFEFALRAKNGDYEKLISSTSDPKKKAEAAAELEVWKERVHRVMMVYVQEYGLGRLIGPRLNWSGIYRDEEWKIQHFRNPGAHTAKSIMPVFPFDDTKFYALNHLLHVFGELNRNELREIWDTNGFNPALAFQAHCSACHGEHMQGNGPVARWIYSIPKNLRNASFLRNLTKERAIQSIMHGVKGTPMPPWGEVGLGMHLHNETPVLQQAEIVQLVDWLFQGVSGAQVISGEKDVLKWQYLPEDALHELKREGDSLKSNSPTIELNTAPSEGGVSAIGLPTGENLYAAQEPVVYVSDDPNDLKVEDFFDVGPSLVEGPEQHSYFIKKKFYTEANLQTGQRLFIENCSVCHGKEGAGNGLRAEAMDGAKPRMLSNPNWLKTRDDLRLLRSIKYGVPGTGMTPWGDYTSTLQRMQMVMFIRQLSHERRMMDELEHRLYEAFETTIVGLGDLHAKAYFDLKKIRLEFERAKNLRESLYEKQQVDGEAITEATKAYQHELELMNKLKKYEEVNQILETLIDQVRQEKNLFIQLGAAFLSKKVDDQILEDLFRLISTNKGRFSVADGGLAVQVVVEEQKKMAQIGNEIIQVISQKVDNLKREQVLLQGKLPSAERDQKLAEVAMESKAYTGLKAKLLSTLEEAYRYHAMQKELVEEFSRKGK